MANSSNENGGSGNSRWWESYLVRYFSGFVVGSLCVFAFLMQVVYLTAGGAQAKQFAANLISKDAPTATIFIAVGLLGFLYCYLVSAPITVIHYGRGVRVFWDKQSRYFWFAWALILAFTASDAVGSLLQHPAFAPFLLIPLLLFFQYSSTLEIEKLSRTKNKLSSSTLFFWMLISIAAWFFISLLVLSLLAGLIPSAKKWQIVLLVFSLPIIWVGVSQYITLFKVLIGERGVNSFYQQLAKARANPQSKEIRESYTHLREHSNSTFIVILELCFFCLVTLAIQTNIGGHQAANEIFSLNGDFLRLAAWLFCIFMIWSIPNLFLWSRANSLERAFASAPTKYMPTEK